MFHSFGDITTSGWLAAILDFWRMSTPHETGSTANRKFNSENIGVAVGISLLCALELEICMGVPSCRQTSQKNRCREKG